MINNGLYNILSTELVILWPFFSIVFNIILCMEPIILSMVSVGNSAMVFLMCLTNLGSGSNEYSVPEHQFGAFSPSS